MTNTPGVLGYEPQDQMTIDVVNENKQIEERILRRIDMLENVPDVDRRWLAIAKTDLQKGFMALNRALFNPQRIDLPED